MKRQGWVNPLWLLIGALMLAGCTAGSMKNVQETGFLGDYSQLKPGGEDQAALIYIRPDFDFKPYTKVMFDRIVIRLSPEAENKDLDPDILKEMADYYQQALLDAFKSGYEIVDQPGPDVLRFRVAITDIKPSKPVANTISTILPVGWVVSGVVKLSSDDNMGTGEAASEMEILDALTGERLAAAVDQRQGGKMAFRGTWTDTKDAFEYWAKRMRERLDQLRGMK